MTQDGWTQVSDAPLYEEHLLLGGRYDALDARLAAPVRYGEAEQAGAAERRCVVADLSGMRALLVSGSESDSFVSAAFACEPLEVGECSPSAVLTGDGAVTSIPLLARTGAKEFLAWDPTHRAELLEPWLGFVADIEQEGFRPYGGVTVENVSTTLVPLLLWGQDAPAVLADYVATAETLPAAGQVRDVRLDRIACLVARPELGEEPCYLLFVPPTAARVLWRSLLSFPVVTPVGTTWLRQAARDLLPWLDDLLRQDRLVLSGTSLKAWRLARAAQDFIGGRALDA